MPHVTVVGSHITGDPSVCGRDNFHVHLIFIQQFSGPSNCGCLRPFGFRDEGETLFDSPLGVRDIGTDLPINAGRSSG